MQSAILSVGGSGGISDPMTQLNAQLQQLQTVAQTQTQAVQTNTTAVAQNTTQLGQGGGSAVGNAVSSAQSAWGLGLGLSPLITGLLSLFGGEGGGSKPAELKKFVLPPALNLSAETIEGSQAWPGRIDYAGDRASRGPGGAQITVQVQAMDSRSFLDHSQDIAAAVRQAMLESSVLNDVLREI